MLDVLHLPGPSRNTQQIFYANAATAGIGWQTWTKPRGISFVQFLVLGGGGGGGAGAAAGTGSAGGGGGGSSAQFNTIFPAWQLPDVLFLSVGYGGVGGTAGGGLATAGIASYISIYPIITPSNVLLAQATGGGLGGIGTTTTSGTAGPAGAGIPKAENRFFASLSLREPCRLAISNPAGILMLAPSSTMNSFNWLACNILPSATLQLSGCENDGTPSFVMRAPAIGACGLT